MATKEIRSPGFVRPPAQMRQPAAPRTNFLLALLPALLLFYAAMMPAEMRLVIGGQTLYPPRLVGFAILPILAYRAMLNPIRWTKWDALYLFGGFWMIIAFMYNYGPGEGIRRGFALAFDAVIPFLAARLCIRSLDDLRRFLVFAAPGLGIVAGSLILEVIAGRLLVKPLFASIFGSLVSYDEGVAVGTKVLGTESRLGIIRAAGPFAHPILAGTFLGTLLPLFYYSGIRGWPRITGLFAALCAALSVSSTALVVLIVGAGVVVVDIVQKMVNFITWKIIIPAGAAFTFLLHMGTENGLINYLIQFTLNPQTARYRRMIWRYGVESVENHPWFGIGFNTYERIDFMVVNSVDAHWLMMAIRFGIIPTFAFLAVALAGMVMVGQAAGRSKGADRNAFVALIAAVLAMIVGGLSVAFFGGVETWFYMMIAIAVSVGMAAKTQQAQVVRRVPMQPAPSGQGPRRAVRPLERVQPRVQPRQR